MRTLLAMALLAASAAAQSTPPPDQAKEHLRFTLILASEADPATTPAIGLLPTDPCLSPADLYLYSDTDSRSLSSTRAATRTPACPAVPIHTWRPIPGQRDPLLAADASSPAATQSSNLLAHILDTLQQAAGTPAAPASPLHENRINGAIGPAGTKVVYLSAHAADLAGIRTLLHLSTNGPSESTPPNTQLLFELWQAVTKQHKNPADDVPGKWAVRLRYRTATLPPPRATAAVDLHPTGCGRNRCDLPVFLHAARATIDPAYTQLDVPPTQIADSKQ